MTSHSPTEAWVAVALAFLGTFIWRFLGVLLAERITSDGPDKMDQCSRIFDGCRCYDVDIGVSRWCFGTTQLDHRLLGFTVGMVLMLVRKLWIAIIGAMGTFALW